MMHTPRSAPPRMPPHQTAAHPMWGPGDGYLVAAKLRNYYKAQARAAKTLVVHVPPPLTALLVDVQATLDATTAPEGPAFVH